MPEVRTLPDVHVGVPTVPGEGAAAAPTAARPLTHTQRQRIAPILAAALGAGMVHVEPVKFDIDPGLRCTSCLRMEWHSVSCRPPRGLVPSEPEPSDLCRWCRHTKDGGPRTGPYLVDENGVDVSVSKERHAMRWAHCWDDGWWDCDAAGYFPAPFDVMAALDAHRAKLEAQRKASE